MFSQAHTRPATLLDFGIASNSQLIVRAILPTEIKVSISKITLLFPLSFFLLSFSFIFFMLSFFLTFFILFFLLAYIFIQVSVPSKKNSKFFPFLIDPRITVAELKYHLAATNQQFADLYPFFLSFLSFFSPSSLLLSFFSPSSLLVLSFFSPCSLLLLSFSPSLLLLSFSPSLLLLSF